MGTWSAHGLTEVSEGTVDAYPGQRLARTWLVYNGCSDRACGLWLARQAAYSTERAPLVRRGRTYVATFSGRVDGCHTTRKGRWTKRFTIDVSDGGSRLHATEVFRSTSPGCSTVPGQDGHSYGMSSWTAAAVSPHCPPSVASCSYGSGWPVLPLAPRAHDDHGTPGRLA